MRVAAISLAGINLNSINHYREDLTLLLRKSGAQIAVLPAYSSIALGISSGVLKATGGFYDTVRSLLPGNEVWNRGFLEIHGRIAGELELYIAAGTIFEVDANRSYHTAYCFDPAGRICCRQHQTHLSRFERELGLNRGEEINLFPLGDLKAGLITGSDARYPEVGRIFGLLGADIILHCGALEYGYNCWPQVAGMWAQVQQNQFWCVEAQLSGRIADRSFGAASAVLGPCEITPGQSGYLARGYPDTPLVAAELDEEARQVLKNEYPLLEILNPAAYCGELF
jgi:predicted amidohydrolase